MNELLIAEPQNTNSAGILEQSMGARNRVGIGLSYRSARLHRLAELTMKSILGLLKSLKIRALLDRNPVAMKWKE
jgi:hypothetical protein